MAFPKKLLNEGEEIVYDLRPHFWFFAKQIGAGLAVIAILIGVNQLSDDPQQVALWVWGLMAVAWSLWVTWRLLVWMNTHFVVTTDKLIFRTGVLSREGREILLERVNDITFRQSLWERIIGAGDLMIESAGEQGQQRFTDIPHPEAVQQEINKQIELHERKVHGDPAARAAPAAEPSIPEQIEKLAALRDQGVLNEQEFEEKKRQLLERM